MFAWLLVFFWWLCYGLVALPFCLLFGLFAGWIWLLLWVLSIVYVFADAFAWSDSSCVVVIMVDSAIWVAVYCFFGGCLLVVYLAARFCVAVRLLSWLVVWIVCRFWLVVLVVCRFVVVWAGWLVLLFWLLDYLSILLWV